MSDIVKQADALVSLIVSYRQAGSTTSNVYSAFLNNAVYVTDNLNSVNNAREKLGSSFTASKRPVIVALNQIDSLRGTEKKPLFFDTSMVYVLAKAIQDMDNKISKLEVENKELRAQVKKLL